MSWETGFSKKELGPIPNNVGMLGYGKPKQRVKGTQGPLWARTCCFKQRDQLFFYTNLELCFPSDSLRLGIIEYFKNHDVLPELGHDNFLICSQHTHSGPGGYCHYPLYNVPTPGFVPKVFQAILKGICESMEEAYQTLTPATLVWNYGEFHHESPVAFNRSTEAYKNNHEVSKFGYDTDPAKALSREMILLKSLYKNQIQGSINWFGVHATNLSNRNNIMSADNKGFAAQMVEEQVLHQQNAPHVALFNQRAAADITPNFIFEKKYNEIRGQFEDAFESARFNGKLQATKALELIKMNNHKVSDEGELKVITRYFDMDGLKVDSEFIPPTMNAPKDAQTVSPALGTSFMAGTEEGRGAPAILCFLVALLSSLVKFIDVIRSFQMPEDERKKMWNFYRFQAPKNVFIETGNKRVLGISNPLKLPIPDFADPTFANMKKLYERGGMREHTWTQQVIPIQMIKIDKVVIVALPAEVTTISAERIEKQVKEELQELNIERVIVNGYANGAAGYLTTPEEYQQGHYEAGHTPFGIFTLPAYQTIIRSLCHEWLGKEYKEAPVSTNPVIFSKQDLEARTLM